ncbi:CocE/NonD family hydrolase [Pseudonocardia sp. N23]|uniref:CocE/NonD family hydrolase n=1 Tax=Pseudonocardia sp. N23 TaxID=1987376 RepID=UPI000C02B844|nr:CocE/NonD family hydrolase [Pseudonocardia sp. N23]GAY08999.1 hydrolase CocE-NonD family protein subfamily [Pseudonocardia sp. N23]
MTGLLSDLTTWANLPVAAADGTELVLDAHVPPATQWPVPVVVTRTPYGRSTHLAEGRSWRSRGFGFVVQDVRGRYDSAGIWTPYRNERADGAALLDWVLDQPWCDGRIAVLGGSYAGYTAWTMAAERPVAALLSLGPSMGLHRTKFEPSGILRLAEHAGWWLDRADARTSRDGLRRLVFAEHPDLLAHLPVSGIADLLGARLPHWTDTLAMHPSDTPAEAVTDAEVRGLAAPSLHVGGWYDLLVYEVLDLHARSGSAVSPRPRRDLVVGPWGHDLGMDGTTTVGAREHGVTARLPLGTLFVEWLRAALDDPTAPGNARVFVPGADRWETTPTWPAPIPTRTWRPGADGTLDDAAAPHGGVTFAHDPADPFPSTLPAADRAPLLARRDAARFATGPLRAPLRVDGAGHADLEVSTTAEGADWVVRLLEHRPDGRLLEVTRGTAVTAGGGPHRIRVPLGACASVVDTGSRLVLEVTGSDFPFLARNLGTGEDRHHGTRLRAGAQTVHTGTSVLALPIGDHRG